MAISERTLVERVNRFLKSLEARGVEPGRWESYCVTRALQALADRDIVAGEAFIDFAKMPPELRSSDTLPDFSPSHPPTLLSELAGELMRIKMRLS